MGWSSKTKPTPANIRKRIAAAMEAIQGARVLALKGEHKRPLKALDNAEAWLSDAEARTRR